MLKFNGAWRFKPPADTEWIMQEIPGGAVDAFRQLINKVATQGDRKEMIEHFKAAFSVVAEMLYYPSSSVGWAESDLDEYMSQSSKNAPLFIEAFFDGCEELQRAKEGFYAPDADLINDICLEFRIGYVVQPPDLVLRGEITPLVPVPERPPTFAEEAKILYQQSLQRAEQLLSEGRSREAVQETLWLLESVTTEFRGLQGDGNVVIKGKYFNDIVQELGRLFQGTTLDRVLDWTKQLHGYLSSPTGGGIRHGLNLQEGISIGPNEARLFCNLIRSYLSFLMAEHERLTRE